ncbi:hypothetical protein DFP73DRAFT_589784 [Morchella snyderi]|nr:hypothetical protein DFP73DRAFT_589784 [Morchella snyderi]
MLASRFPYPSWRACIQFGIIRNKSSASIRHWSNSSGLTKPQAKTKAPASTSTSSSSSTSVSAEAGEGKKKSIGNNGEKAGLVCVPVHVGDNTLPTSTVKNPREPLQKTPLKNTPATGELEVPEQVFDEIIQTPINAPAFEIDSLGRQYELRYIDCKPTPMTARIYHPQASSSLNGNKILYLPSTIPNSFFPSHDSIISTLSQITSSTIIYPVPADTAEPFPQSIHNLLRIYDATTDKAPTAIITSGIAATTATAMAMTEAAIKGIGIWGGIFDLTKYSATSTRWNRPLEHWEHLPTNALPPVPESTNSLTISKDEFKALRRHYYPNPETWLDPHASPLAFFMRSKVVLSRMNLTEINGEAVRKEMVKMSSYSESDWEAEVYIYPRIDLTLRTWNIFPPPSREDFPKIRIVAPEKKEGAEENGSDVVFAQAEKFGSIAKKGLANWYKWKLRSSSADTSASTTRLSMTLSEEVEVMKEAESEAEMVVKVDTLSKEDTGVEEVNLMAHWIKWVLQGPLARN